MGFKNKFLVYFLISVFLTVAVFVYYTADPSKEFFFLKCPFKFATGLDCPGCGAQRAFHELLHFNIAEAFRYNPLLISAIPYVGLGIIFQRKKIAEKYPRMRRALFGQYAIRIVLSIILLYFVIRNL